MRRALIWNLLNYGASQIGSIVVFFLLARQLSPTVFGVFALSALIVDLLALQGRSALTDALLQRRDFSQTMLSTAFWSALAAAALFVGLAMAAAQPLADMLDAPALATALPALAGTALVMPLAAVLDALVLKDFGFRALALRNVAGVLIGGAAALSFAFSPLSMWALVAQRWGIVLVAIVLTWRFVRWRPSWTFAFPAARSFARAAVPLWLGQALAAAPGRAVDAVVGARLGVDVLGGLRVGSKFAEALYAPLTGAFQTLWVPLLSGFERGSATPGRLFLQAIALVALAATPAFLGVGLVGEELAALVIGPNYPGAGQVIMLTSLAGLYLPLAFFRGAIFAATRHNRLLVAFGVTEVSCVAGGALLSAPFGLVAMLLTLTLIAGILALASAYFTARCVGAHLGDYARAIAPAYLASGVMVAGVLLLGRMAADLPPILTLAMKAALGAALYAGWLAVFHRRWAMAAIALFAQRGQAQQAAAQTEGAPALDPSDMRAWRDG